MPRTHSGPHRTLLGGQSLNFHHKVEVENETGTWIDLTAWTQTIDWNESIDSPVMGGVVKFIREHGTGGTLSLAPLISGSTLNVDDFAAYSPLIHPGRGFRYSLAVTSAGVAPVGGDWHLVFDGQLDEPDAAQEPNTVAVNIRDIGARPLDQIIEEEREYGSDVGIPIETVLEQMWADNGFPGVTIALPDGSPGAVVHPYKQARGGSLFEAGRTLALQIGWDLRHRWGSGDSFELTLGDVDRTKTTADLTIPPSEYLKVTKAVIDDQFIRNVGKLKYTNRASGTIGSVTASDSASINTFGRRYIEIAEDWTKGISSESEAQNMLDAVIADLKDPIVDFDIQTFYLWPVQLHDLIETPSNTVHFDSAQKLAVVGMQVHVEKDLVTQTLQTRGKPAGAYAEWIKRHGLGPEPGDGPPAPIFTYLLGEESHGGGVTGDGMVWIGVKFERNTQYIEVWAEEGADDNTPTPNIANNSSALRLFRQEGVDSSADDWETLVGIATRPQRWRKIRACGFGYNGQKGPDWIPPAVQAIDPTPTPADGTIASMTVTSGQLDTNIIAVTPGTVDAAGGNWIILRRDGVDIIPVFIDDSTALVNISDVGINPHANYTYEAFIWNNGVTGKHRRHGSGIPTAPGFDFDQASPKLIFDAGLYKVGIYWTVTGFPTADHIHFEFGSDGMNFTDFATADVSDPSIADLNFAAKWYRMRLETAGNVILAYSSARFFPAPDLPPSQGSSAVPTWNPVPSARILRAPNVSIGVPTLVMGHITPTSGAVECVLQSAPDSGGSPGAWSDTAFRSARLAGEEWNLGPGIGPTWYRLSARDAADVSLAVSSQEFWQGFV